MSYRYRYSDAQREADVIAVTDALHDDAATEAWLRLLLDHDVQRNRLANAERQLDRMRGLFSVPMRPPMVER